MAINAKLQTLINIKNDIGTAITNKGGTITGETPFFNYASEIDNISTGTPQTIFAASDGSKWALTNVVNYVNSAGNVTHDFNRWELANNSTSDPIMTVGTVGANISGNIRIVQVNQVNIAQYVNIVINDTTGAKYVGYNGYDSQTNPTPTGNTTFNRWLLNNSASGTVIFANTTVTSGGTFNGPNTVITANISNIAFINNTAEYGGTIWTSTTNNGFIYAGGRIGSFPFSSSSIKKYHQSNGVQSGGESSGYGSDIFAITVNNGFVYIGGGGTGDTKKYHESNLGFVGNTIGYGGGEIRAIKANNGFLYRAGGFGSRRLEKFYESNLTLQGNTPDLDRETRSITINNGFVYISGSFNGVRKYHESNLVFVGNTAHRGDQLRSVTTSNGFIYAGGENNSNSSNSPVAKYYESNLAFVGNTAIYGGSIQSVTTNNGFIYVGGETNQTVQKFHESNLAFVNNTVSLSGTIYSITTENGFFFAGGPAGRVHKYQEQGTTTTLETKTFYTATKIKE